MMRADIGGIARLTWAITQTVSKQCYVVGHAVLLSLATVAVTTSTESGLQR